MSLANNRSIGVGLARMSEFHRVLGEQYAIRALWAVREQSVTMSTLAQALHCDNSRASRCVIPLCAIGLMVRTKDGRNQWCRLAPGVRWVHDPRALTLSLCIDVDRVRSDTLLVVPVDILDVRVPSPRDLTKPA